jgi:hypothetical protein
VTQQDRYLFEGHATEKAFNREGVPESVRVGIRHAGQSKQPV